VSFAPAIKLRSPVLYPYSIAAGDLTGNGIPDLAVVGIEQSALLHALGKGDGYFGPWSDKGGTGDAPGFVIFADVDLDGKLDAVTTDATQPIVTVSFGDGKGHFNRGVQPDTGVGYATNYLAVADLNGDGIPDIVGTASVVGEDWGQIFVLLGKGNREFEKPAHLASGGFQPQGIAVADLNHDGIPDLVVANFGKQPPYGNIAVLLGNGDGTFAKPVTYQLGQYHDPYGVTLGDFNGDGNIDMAVTTQRSNDVQIFLGRGDGTFSRQKLYYAGIDPYSVAIADFNGDGIPDLAITNYTSPKHCHVSVLLGDGDGSFQKPIHFPVGLSPVQIVVADFNHDGKPDIATINQGNATVSILLNTTQLPTRSASH
jgi:hypothetical protein